MTHFKVCPNCAFVWKTRNDFLYDINVSILGYQVNSERFKQGFFLFNHSCKSTLSIVASHFEDLYDFPGHFLRQNVPDPCPVECERSFVREIMQILKKREASIEQEMPWTVPIAKEHLESGKKNWPRKQKPR